MLISLADNLIFAYSIIIIKISKYKILMGIGDWGLGIGGLGIGDWPNPQNNKNKITLF